MNKHTDQPVWHGVKLWKSKENINNNKIISWEWTLANGKKWTTNTKCYSRKGIFNWNNLPFRHGFFFSIWIGQFDVFSIWFESLFFFCSWQRPWPMVCAHTCQTKNRENIIYYTPKWINQRVDRVSKYGIDMPYNGVNKKHFCWICPDLPSGYETHFWI